MTEGARPGGGRRGAPQRGAHGDAGSDPRAAIPRGVHLQFLPMYADFCAAVSQDLSQERLMALVDAKQPPARSGVLDAVADLKHKRRAATACLVLGLPKQALKLANVLVKLRFEWPYGHVLQADALLALGRLVDAWTTYQLALQLLPPPGGPVPLDDFGRAQVEALCGEVAAAIAARSRRASVHAHASHITAMAAWPPIGYQHHRTGKLASSIRSTGSATDLVAHMDHIVNRSLEVISQTGALPSSRLLPDDLSRSSLLAIPSRGTDSTASSEYGTPAESPTAAAVSTDSLDAWHVAAPLERTIDSVRPGGAAPMWPEPPDDPPLAAPAALPALLVSDATTTAHTDADGLFFSDFPAPSASRHSSAPLLNSRGTPRAWGWPAASDAGTASIEIPSHARDAIPVPWGAPPPRFHCRYFLATASLDRVVRVWDLESATCVNELHSLTAAVRQLVWSNKPLAAGGDPEASSLQLASGCADGVVAIWVLNTKGELQEEMVLLQHEWAVTGLAFTPDDQQLVSAGADGLVCVWEVATGKLIAKLSSGGVSVALMATLPVRSTLALVTVDVAGTWRLWDLRTRDCVAAGHLPAECVWVEFTPRVSAVSPPRPLLLTCHWNVDDASSSICLWDAFNQKAPSRGELEPLQTFDDVEGRVACVAVATGANGQALAAIACDGGTLVLLDLDATSVLSHVRHAHGDAEGQGVAVTQLAFSPDARILFSAGVDGTIKARTTADMEVLVTLTTHSARVTCARLCGRGWTLASADAAGDLAIWSLQLIGELARSASPALLSSSGPLQRSQAGCNTL